ncbi:hypothetical protein VH567_07930 [Sphingomonas sp. 4RDLI-65]|uniref:hypothetical protein n=1 Tax=Sphingomonas sp. 4RDLI-65 TaxID=3111641 RepID=UPI003C174BAF
MQSKEYRVGLARGRVTQTIRARDRDTDIWSALISIAHWQRPKTLREYVVHLAEMGVETARGGPWTTGLVNAAMRKHGVNPKRLLERVTTPPVHEPPKEPTQEQYQRWREASEELAEDGVWILLTQTEAKRNERIRHRELGEGQFVREAGAKVVGSFMDWDDETFGTSEKEVRAIDTEVFRHRLTPDALERANDRLRATYLTVAR